MKFFNRKTRPRSQCWQVRLYGFIEHVEIMTHYRWVVFKEDYKRFGPVVMFWWKFTYYRFKIATKWRELCRKK